jgi:beta-glucanase (GH16 family)
MLSRLLARPRPSREDKKFMVFAALTLLMAGCGAAMAPSPPSSGPHAWTIAWSDEFDAPDGSGPNLANWHLEVGGDGWGNQELEYYTNRLQNASIQGGMLVITALRETYTGMDGVTRDYTSARLTTQNLFTQSYGRFEARIKIPYGQGLWPAFWMLGSNINTAGFPGCGEIDIFENIGFQPSTIYGSVHGPGPPGTYSVSQDYSLAGGARFADDFHIFAVEWEPDVVRFYVDQNLYETVTPADLSSGDTWVFDHPFFLILNVAVGGGWPGSPDSSTVFPQKMLVDYVRVYR